MFRSLSLTLAMLTGACVGPLFVERDAMLWHRSGAFAVPDLAGSGREPGAWMRVELDGAQIAFSSQDGRVIAVRSWCDEDQQPIDVENRHLWLGLPSGDRQRRRVQVAGVPAIETTGLSSGVRIQTVVVEAGDCTVDLAYAAREGQHGTSAFERFLGGVRVRREL